MGLGVQLETVESFFQESQGLARGSGFAARLLIASLPSIQGSWFWRDAPSSKPGMAAYGNRIRQLLDKAPRYNERGELAPTPLDMDLEAFATWRTFYDDVEREVGGTGELWKVQDVASKIAKNCARIAALFHVFEHGPGGRIARDHVDAAAAIVEWHLAESMRFLGGLTLPKSIANALKLEKWLVAVYRDGQVDGVTTREIINCGPNSVRLKADMLAALAELVDAHRVRLEDKGRRIELNPALCGA